jgi:hypothetical protein
VLILLLVIYLFPSEVSSLFWVIHRTGSLD